MNSRRSEFFQDLFRRGSPEDRDLQRVLGDLHVRDDELDPLALLVGWQRLVQRPELRQGREHPLLIHGVLLDLVDRRLDLGDRRLEAGPALPEFRELLLQEDLPLGPFEPHAVKQAFRLAFDLVYLALQRSLPGLKGRTLCMEVLVRDAHESAEEPGAPGDLPDPAEDDLEQLLLGDTEAAIPVLADVEVVALAEPSGP